MCTFSHSVQGRRPVCKFYEQNKSCRYGEGCKFQHDTQQPDAKTVVPKAAPPSSSTPESAAAVAYEGGGSEECGICLENVPASGKRFGLLSCDHVYCLECIRKWRNSKGLKDVCRGCPECRQMSFFVVPSKTHLMGEEKVKAINAYKERLASRPCKQVFPPTTYHRPDGSNTCPFGKRCFYAHLDAEGNDVKDSQPAPTLSRRSFPHVNAHGVGWGREARTRWALGGRDIAGGGGGDRRWQDPRGMASWESMRVADNVDDVDLAFLVSNLENLMLEGEWIFG
ncbi:unnamed protein product [Choristocarpus tenellus]